MIHYVGYYTIKETVINSDTTEYVMWYTKTGNGNYRFKNLGVAKAEAGRLTALYPRHYG